METEAIQHSPAHAAPRSALLGDQLVRVDHDHTSSATGPATSGTPNQPVVCRWLVLGYGNTLRQDDQAGPLVVDEVEALALPGVRTIACAQLCPEHAQEVAQAAAVVFVDAQVGPGRSVFLRRVLPGETPQLITHTAEPPTLLAIAREVYGRCPPAWLLTIPAESFGFGTEVSPLAREGVAVAVAEITELSREDF